MPRGQVKRHHILGDILLAGAVLVLQIDVCPAVGHAQIFGPQLGAELFVAAVEDKHIGVGHLLHHQLPHVFQVRLKGVGVHEADDLIQHPVSRQRLAVQRLHHPHAVVLYNDLLGLILLLQLFQQLDGQLSLILHGVGEHIVQRLGIVLLLAFLAANEQSAVLGGKTVPENAVNKFCFAGVQKSGDEIYGNIHTCSFSLTG